MVGASLCTPRMQASRISCHSKTTDLLSCGQPSVCILHQGPEMSSRRLCDTTAHSATGPACTGTLLSAAQAPSQTMQHVLIEEHSTYHGHDAGEFTGLVPNSTRRALPVMRESDRLESHLHTQEMLSGAVWAQRLGHKGISVTGPLSGKDVMDCSIAGRTVASERGNYQIGLTCIAPTASDEELACRRRDGPSVMYRTTNCAMLR